MLVAVAAFVALPAGPALAADEIGLSIAPAGADGAADGRSRFDYQADPGQQISDQVSITNTGTVEVPVTVLATDAFNSPEGTFSLLETKDQPADAGSWVTFAGTPGQVTMTLAPGETRVIPFVLVIPADATPGDHAAGIIVSAVQGGQIAVDRRVATRLYARVKGDIQAGLTISSISADYSGGLSPFNGQLTVTYTITNSGNIALGALTNVSATTFFGMAVGDVVKDNIDEMLPGAERTIVVTVPQVPETGYVTPKVTIFPTYSPFSLVPPQPLNGVARDTTVIFLPWWLVLVLIAAVVIGVVVWLRRRSDRKRAKEWIEYTEAEALRKAAEQPEMASAINESRGS